MGKPKVLIIEDNADLLGILRQLLSTEYDVSTARRGEEGVALAVSVRPDVVILDLQLPCMSGMEAGRWIKREVGPVPILVLTALTDPAATEAVMRSGCCDSFMSKPASLHSIRSRVAELMGSGSGARE
ncbi:MAG TPA: response regulator [Longimicrobiales bacterium]|nr:response regulator [Longimicrobiales bacterium]